MNRLIKNGKPILWLVIVAFLANTLFAQAPVQADEPFLPVPGQLIALTPAYSLPLIRGIKVFKNNPFKFEFVMSQGDSYTSQAVLKDEANKLVKYFLASLTTPEKDMWVNLSPYERNRIVPSEFGVTEMGKELLAQDYLLKQVTASIMYPEGAVGKEFWHKIYSEAYKRFGTTNIPVNTFNKVWIVPDTAEVYENAKTNTAVIIKSSLKVMLEEDYLALTKNAAKTDDNDVHSLGSQVIREIIIPALTKEVNEGKNFAVLRQVYNSLILAFWYKSKLKQSLISKGYVDRNKTGGVDVNDKQVDQKIYNQYLKSYKKGVYNYIKEEIDPANQYVPRKYFSGGMNFGDNFGQRVEFLSGPASARDAAMIMGKGSVLVSVGLAAAIIAGVPSLASANTPSAPGTAATYSTTVTPYGTPHGTVADIVKSIGQEKNFGWLVQHNRVHIFKYGHEIKGRDLGRINVGEEVRVDLTGFGAAKPIVEKPAAVAPAPLNPFTTAASAVGASASNLTFGTLDGIKQAFQNSFKNPFASAPSIQFTQEPAGEPMVLTGGAYNLVNAKAIPLTVKLIKAGEKFTNYFYRDFGKHDQLDFGWGFAKQYFWPLAPEAVRNGSRKLTPADADLMLMRKLPEYIIIADNLLGQDASGQRVISTLSTGAQADAIQFVYQSGSLPPDIIAAFKTGNNKVIADSIRARLIHQSPSLKSRADNYENALFDRPITNVPAETALQTTSTWDLKSLVTAPYTLPAGFNTDFMALSYNAQDNTPLSGTSIEAIIKGVHAAPLSALKSAPVKHKVAPVAAASKPVAGPTVNITRAGRGGLVVNPMPAVEAGGNPFANILGMFSKPLDVSPPPGLIPLDQPLVLSGAIIRPVDDTHGVMITSGFGLRHNPTPNDPNFGTSILGAKEFHKGVDYGVPIGTPLRAPISGKVIAVNLNENARGGIYVIVEENKNGKEIQAKVMHLSSVAGNIQVGTMVKIGDPIGKSGMTGRATGPHTYYEVDINGVAVNPELIVSKVKMASTAGSGVKSNAVSAYASPETPAPARAAIEKVLKKPAAGVQVASLEPVNIPRFSLNRAQAPTQSTVKAPLQLAPADVPNLAQSDFTFEVLPGDSLSGILARVDRMHQYNALTLYQQHQISIIHNGQVVNGRNPNLIYPGEKVAINLTGQASSVSHQLTSVSTDYEISARRAVAVPVVAPVSTSTSVRLVTPEAPAFQSPFAGGYQSPLVSLRANTIGVNPVSLSRSYTSSLFGTPRLLPLAVQLSDHLLPVITSTAATPAGMVTRAHWTQDIGDTITTSLHAPVRLGEPPDAAKYKDLKGDYQATLTPSEAVGEEAFVQDKDNELRGRVLMDSLNSPNAPYVAIVSTDKDHMYGIQKSFSEWLGNGSDHDANSYMDFIFGNGNNTQGISNVTFKILQGPSADNGKVDLSNINDRRVWKEIINPEQVDKNILNKKNIWVQVSWSDKTGNHSGVVYSSHKAAEISLKIMIHAQLDREITQAISAILAMDTYQQQISALTKLHALHGLDSKDQSTGKILVGAIVERDEFGLITGVKGFIHESDITAHVIGVPGNGVINAKEQLNVVIGGHEIPVKYWPYTKQSTVMSTFSFYNRDELNMLKEANTAPGISGTYLTQHGGPPLMRGDVILGENIARREAIDNDVGIAMTEYNALAANQFKDYLHDKLITNLFFTAANMGLSFTGLNLPNAFAGNIIFDLFERPDKIGTQYPTRDMLEQIFADRQVREMYIKTHQQQIADNERIRGKMQETVAKLVILGNYEKDHQAEATADYLKAENQAYIDAQVEKTWNNMTADQKKDLMAHASQSIKDFYSEKDMEKFQAYIKRINDEKFQGFVISQLSMSASLASQYLPSETVTNGQYYKQGPGYKVETAFLAPKSQALYSVLSQQYFSFDGQMNIPNVIGLMTSGKAFNTYSFAQLIGKAPVQKLGQIQGVVAPTSNLFDTISRITSVINVTVDLKSFANEVHGDELTSPYPLAPQETRFNFYLFGFPLSILNQEELAQEMVNNFNSKEPKIFIEQDGHFTSKITTFDAKSFRTLYSIPRAIPIGKLHFAQLGIDGHALPDVPVYAIQIVTHDGKVYNKVAVFNKAFLELRKIQIEKEIQRYEGYTASLANGGAIIQVGSQGGTINQNIYTGLIKSHSQEDIGDAPDAFTWDQAGADRVLMEDGKWDPVKRNLDFFKEVMDAQMKIDTPYSGFFSWIFGNNSSFQGFSKAYNAYTGEPQTEPDVAGTAAIAQTVMVYEQKTGDTQTYHKILTESIKWLEKVQSSHGGGGLPNTPRSNEKYTEPNFVVYKVLSNYGTFYHDQEASNAAAGILQWASSQTVTYTSVPVVSSIGKGRSGVQLSAPVAVAHAGHGLWDEQRHLLRSGENTDVFSSDAQTRALSALGPQGFVDRYLQGNPENLINYLVNIDANFGVTVPNYHNGQKPVRLLDLEDGSKDKALERKNLSKVGQSMRIGFPEDTSEYVQDLKDAKAFLASLGLNTRKVDDLTSTYSRQLAAMADARGNLPQATVDNEYSGFGYRTAIGHWSLAPWAWNQMNNVMGINFLEINGTARGNGLGLKPSKIEIPPYQLTYSDLNEGTDVKAGLKNYQYWRDQISNMVAQSKAHPNPNIMFVNPLNNQEIVFRDKDGSVKRVLLVAPKSELIEHVKSTIEATAENALERMAQEGIGDYAKGGAIFETADDRRIGHIRDSSEVEKILKIISTLPEDQQNFINYKQYSRFTLYNYVLDGKKYDSLIVTLSFPLHKPVAFDFEDSFGLTKTMIAEEGHLRFVVNDQKATLFYYNDKTYAESSTIDYPLLPGGRTATVNALKDSSKSLQERQDLFKKNNILPLGESYTEKAVHVDATKVSLKSINPYDVVLEKRAIDYNTGNITTQGYGLFTRPVWEADNYRITYNYFNKYGIFTHAETFLNIGTKPLQAHQNGDLIYRDTAYVINKEGQAVPLDDSIADLKDQHFMGWVYQEKVKFGVGRVLVFDARNFGDKIAGLYNDLFTTPDGKTYGFTTAMTLKYDPNFYGGRVAIGTDLYTGQPGDGDHPQDMVHSGEITALSYDPLKGVMQVKEKYLHTGQEITETYQRGTENAVVKDNGTERTGIVYNRDETQSTAVTTIKGTVVIDSKAQYDPDARQWDQSWTQWVDKANNIVLEHGNTLLSPNGVKTSTVNKYADNIIVDNSINRRHTFGYDQYGFENYGLDELWNSVTKQWVPEASYGHYTFANGVVKVDRLDLAHNKTISLVTDLNTGMPLSVHSPEGSYKDQFGHTIEGDITATYAYDSPYPLLPGHVTTDRGEYQILKGLNGSLVDWEAHAADGKVFYEQKDLSLRNRIAGTEAYFTSSGENVKRDDPNAVSSNKVTFTPRPLTADNVLDIDSSPNSESSNIFNGHPKNTIDVAGDYDAARNLETYKSTIDEQRSNKEETVVKKEILSDEGKVIRKIYFGYQYGADRILWAEIGDKRVEYDWGSKGSFNFDHGIPDEIWVFDLSKSIDGHPGIVAKHKLLEIDSIRNTILDPDNKNGVWEEVSPKRVRLKPNIYLKEEDVRKIAKDGFDKIWAILQQPKATPVYTVNTKNFNEKDGTSLVEITHFFGDKFDQSWIETMDLAPNQDILRSVADMKNDQGNFDQKTTYYIYGSPKDIYTPLDQGVHDFPGVAGNTKQKDYLYFFVDSQDSDAYDGIEAVVSDGKQSVTFSAKLDDNAYFNEIGSARQVQHMPFLFPYAANVISYPIINQAQRETSVVANFRSLQGRNPYVMPVQWLADAGLDINNIQSVQVHYKGQSKGAITVSPLKFLGEKIDIKKREDSEQLLIDLKSYIADARVQTSSNGTVQIDEGWNKTIDKERKRHQIELLDDGRPLMTRFDRDEGLGRWTPLTTLYDFDLLHERAKPTMHLYSGYPGITVADKLDVVYDGDPRGYTVPVGPFATSVAGFASNQTGEEPVRTVYSGNIIVDHNATFSERLTANDAYMTFARTKIHQFNQNFEHEPGDKKQFDKMKKNPPNSFHPDMMFVQNTPYWKLVDGDNSTIDPTSDWINIAQELRNPHTGLIPLDLPLKATDPKGQSKYVDMIKEGELLSSMVLSGRPDAITMAEQVLLNVLPTQSFSIFNITRGGRLPLAQSLDIETGAPYLAQAELNNPQVALPLAEVQVSMANAAYLLWQKDHNPDALTLTQNLIQGLMDNYYDKKANIGPFSEEEFEVPTHFLGIEFKGRQANYYTRTNAKIYLLLNAMSTDASLPNEFSNAVKDHKKNLEEYFKNYALKKMLDPKDPESIVPFGMFSNQNSNNELEEIPGSSVDTWNYFIEAARQMGMDDKKAALLFDTMGRVHGIKIGSQYGFNADIKPGEESIDMQDTVDALRTAKMIGYTQAKSVLQDAVAGAARTEENLIPAAINQDGSITRTSLPASSDLMLEKSGSGSVYDFKRDISTGSLETGRPDKAMLSLWALGLLYSTLLLPFLNLFTGKMTKKWSLFGNSKIEDFEKEDLAKAEAFIAQTIEGEQKDKYVRFLKNNDSRTLDIMAAQGFTDMIATMMYLKREPRNLGISDESIKNYIRSWSEYYAREFELQNQWWKDNSKKRPTEFSPENLKIETLIDLLDAVQNKDPNKPNRPIDDFLREELASRDGILQAFNEATQENRPIDILLREKLSEGLEGKDVIQALDNVSKMRGLYKIMEGLYDPYEFDTGTRDILQKAMKEDQDRQEGKSIDEKKALKVKDFINLNMALLKKVYPKLMELDVRKDLVQTIRKLLKINNLYIKLEDRTILNNLSNVTRQLFQKAEKGTLGDQEYKTLNWGLLEILYPNQIKRTLTEEEQAEKSKYKNPRFHPSALINTYMWGKVKDLRAEIVSKGNIEDQLKQILGSDWNNAKPYEKWDKEEKDAYEKWTGQQRKGYEAWAQIKLKETRNVFVLAAARNLSLMYWIFVAAAFVRSEITDLQLVIADFVQQNPLISLLNTAGNFIPGGNLLLGVAGVMGAFLIPGKGKVSEIFRGISVIGGITFLGTWLIGLVGNHFIDNLFSSSMSVATGSHLITDAFWGQVGQHPVLLLLGLGILAVHWLSYLVPNGHTVNVLNRPVGIHDIRRVLGVVGAWSLAAGLAVGLHVTDAATGLFMYSTVLGLAFEGMFRLIFGHSTIASAIRYYFTPQFYFEGVKPFTMNFMVKAVYFTSALITIMSIFPQIETKLAVGDFFSWLQLSGGYTQMMMGLALSHYAIQIIVFTLIGAVGYTLPKYLKLHLPGLYNWVLNKTEPSQAPQAAALTDKDHFVIKAVAFEEAIPNAEKSAQLIPLWNRLVESYPNEYVDLYNYLMIQGVLGDITLKNLEDAKWGGKLYRLLNGLAKYEEDPKNLDPATELPVIRVLRVEDIPDKVPEGNLSADELRAAFHIRHYISLRTGLEGTTSELYTYILSLALQVGERGKNTQLLLISNNWGKMRTGKEYTKELELLRRTVILWDKLTGRKNSTFPSMVIVNATPSVNKVGSETNAIPYISPDTKGEYVLDRQVVSYWADRIFDTLEKFAQNSNKPGSKYLVSAPSVRTPAATSNTYAAAVKMQEVTEGAFGHFVVGTEALSGNGGAYGWAGFQAYDYNDSIVEFMKQGLNREPISPYQQDLISEDIAREKALSINAQDRGLKPDYEAAETEAIKIREENISQHWFSWIRWTSGWPQMNWNFVMQQRFFFGNLPLSQREYRMGIAGIFTMAPLAIAYITTLPLGVVTGSTFFVGLSAIFYLWGLFQGQSSIFGSLFAGILKKGFFVGLSGWLISVPRNMMLIGGTQLYINASGVISAFIEGVSPVFVLMKLPQQGEESHGPYFGFQKSTDNWWIWNKLLNWKPDAKDWWILRNLLNWKPDANVKKIQTFIFPVGVGTIGAGIYLWALSDLDILNLGLNFIMYIQLAAAILAPFLYHEKIGKKISGGKLFLARTLAFTITTAAIFGFVIGINEPGWGLLAPAGLVLFFLTSTVTAWRHMYLKIDTFEFQEDEFRGSLEKIKPLLEKLRQPKDSFTGIKSAVNWLNDSIIPFKDYVGYINTHRTDEGISKLLPEGFVSFSNDDFKKLTRTTDGQKLKREILNQLYPQETPKGLKYKANTSASYDELRGFLSEMSRASWAALILQLPFVVIKIAGILYLEIGTHVGVIPFDKVALGAIYLGVPILGTILLGKWLNNKFKVKAHSNYETMSQKLNKSGLTTANRERAERSLMAYRHHINDEDWLLAKQQKAEFHRILPDNAMLVISSSLDPSALMAQQILAPIRDNALLGHVPVNRFEKGGIDLSQTMVRVQSSGELIQTAFDDPAILRLLLNSDGLAPIIYGIKNMTPTMVNNFVGLN